jgi:hypothetical protein
VSQRARRKTSTRFEFKPFHKSVGDWGDASIMSCECGEEMEETEQSGGGEEPQSTECPINSLRTHPREPLFLVADAGLSQICSFSRSGLRKALSGSPALGEKCDGFPRMFCGPPGDNGIMSEYR